MLREKLLSHPADPTYSTYAWPCASSAGAHATSQAVPDLETTVLAMPATVSVTGGCSEEANGLNQPAELCKVEDEEVSVESLWWICQLWVWGIDSLLCRPAPIRRGRR